MNAERLYNESGVFKFTYRDILREGSTFGELGLLEGKPRSAMIVCSEDSEFAIMEKKDYSELLAERDKKNLQKKFEFLKKHLFPDLTNDAIRKIFYSFSKLSMKKNEILFSQGNQASGVYIIKTGEVSLSGKFDSSHSDSFDHSLHSRDTTTSILHEHGEGERGKEKSLRFKPKRI